MISSIKLSLLAQLCCNQNDMLEYRSSAVSKRWSYANFLKVGGKSLKRFKE